MSGIWWNVKFIDISIFSKIIRSRIRHLAKNMMAKLQCNCMQGSFWIHIRTCHLHNKVKAASGKSNKESGNLSVHKI